MAIDKEYASVQTKVEKRIEQLKKVAESQYPIDPAMADRHEYRVSMARTYLGELKEVESLLSGGCGPVWLVPEFTYYKQISGADFATVEYDGFFCKIVCLQNYPSNMYWLVCMAPLDSI